MIRARDSIGRDSEVMVEMGKGIDSLCVLEVTVDKISHGFDMKGGEKYR